MPEREYFPGAVQHDLRMEAQADVQAVKATGQNADGTPAADPGDGLDGKTKDELLQEAEARGVEVRTSGTKQEILDALRAAG